MTTATDLLRPDFGFGTPTYSSYQEWLLLHDIEFHRFLQHNFSETAQEDAIKKFFWKDPRLGVEKTIDYSTPNDIKVEALKDLLATVKFGEFLFIGANQTGKTALMFTIGEWLYERGRAVAWLGAPALLPEYISLSTIDYYEIPKKYAVIFDEGGVRQSHRRAMSSENIDFSLNLPTISHKKQIVLFGTQLTSIADKFNTLLHQGLFCKSMTEPQKDAERAFIRKYGDWIPTTPDKSITYVRWEQPPPLNLTVKLPLPNWWNDDFSTPYDKFDTDEEALKYADELFIKWMDFPNCIKKIALEMKRKGYNQPETFWCERFGVER